MRRNDRLVMSMAGRAAKFCADNPDPNPATAQVAVRLTALRDRATDLTELQQQGLATSAAAVKQKEQLRESIGIQLSALVASARQAAKGNPEIAVHRRLPRNGRHSNEMVLLTTARVAVAEAGTILPLLEPHGATQELLTSLTQLLDEFEQELDRQRRAVNSQVGATANLRAVCSDILSVVRNLDALHRLRFQGDPERLAAWKSARKVARIQPPEEAEPPVDGSQAA